MPAGAALLAEAEKLTAEVLPQLFAQVRAFPDHERTGEQLMIALYRGLACPGHPGDQLALHVPALPDWIILAVVVTLGACHYGLFDR
jgi:hypothetical protein